MSEDRIQQNCYIWFHNNYSDLRGLLCYNLNNSRNKVDGARNKSLGLQAGRSDMVLYYHARAVMIEFKKPDGRQSAGQTDWQRVVEAQGFRYEIIRSEQEFQELIKSIIRR